MGGRSGESGGNLNKRIGLERVYPGGPTLSEYYADITDVIFDWTMDPPEPGTSRFKFMTKRLDEYVKGHIYQGTVYRGIELASDKEVEQRFKEGSIVKAGDKQRHVSFTTDLAVAQDYTTSIRENTTPVVLVTQNVKNARFLQETEGSMNEVLARNSNNYKVLQKKKRDGIWYVYLKGN